MATSAVRSSNDTVVRRVSIDGVTGDGGIVGGELTSQQLESVAPLLDGMSAAEMLAAWQRGKGGEEGGKRPGQFMPITARWPGGQYPILGSGEPEAASATPSEAASATPRHSSLGPRNSGTDLEKFYTMTYQSQLISFEATRWLQAAYDGGLRDAQLHLAHLLFDMGTTEMALEELREHLSWRVKRGRATCDGCGQTRGEDKTPMLTCSGCRVARFCNADHQKMASKKAGSGGSLFTGRHKDICGVLSKWRAVVKDGVASDTCTPDLVAYLQQKNPYRHCDKVSGTDRLCTSADAAEAVAFGLKRAVAARKLLSEEAAAVAGHRVVRDGGAVPEVYESPAAALLRDLPTARKTLEKAKNSEAKHALEAAIMEAEQAAVQEKKLRDWKVQMLQMKEMREKSRQALEEAKSKAAKATDQVLLKEMDKLVEAEKVREKDFEAWLAQREAVVSAALQSSASSTLIEHRRER